MTPVQAEALAGQVTAFARAEPGISAAAVCGSWARGEARPSSDLDIVLLAADPDRWRDLQLLAARLLPGSGFDLAAARAADYGAVWSAHLRLRPEAELELSFAAPGWACADPVDPGTRAVVEGGFRVLLDERGAFERLLAAVRGG